MAAGWRPESPPGDDCSTQVVTVDPDRAAGLSPDRDDTPWFVEAIELGPSARPDAVVVSRS